MLLRQLLLFSGGGGSSAAATAVLTTNANQNGYTHALVSFYNGGVGMTVDASTSAWYVRWH